LEQSVKMPSGHWVNSKGGFMIFDIYEQPDLYEIAKCARQATLIDWLNVNRIPFAFNAKQKVIVHKHALDAGLGVMPLPANDPEPKVELGYAKASQ
jgi:hypothetical protein